jgi:hypothetical protein
MAMNVHEKFYGRAVEEIAKGIRRDDLWAKALALSAGDTKKGQAIYVDLLARHFSDEESAEKTKQQKMMAISATRKAFIVVAKIGVWLLLVGGLTAALVATIGLMKEEYSKEQARNFIPEKEELVPYYRVILSIEQGEPRGEVPEYVLDSFYLGLMELNDKYSYGRAERMLYNKDSAGYLYRNIVSGSYGWPEEAVKKYPIEWALLVLAFLSALVGVTLAVVKYPFRKTPSDDRVSPNNSLQARRP